MRVFVTFAEARDAGSDGDALNWCSNAREPLELPPPIPAQYRRNAPNDCFVRYFGRSTLGNLAGEPQPAVVGHDADLIPPGVKQ